MNPANYVNIYASAREEKNYGPSFKRTNYVNIYVSTPEKKNYRPSFRRTNLSISCQPTQLFSYFFLLRKQFIIDT